MITANYHPLIAQSTYVIDNTGHFRTYASLPYRLLCELYTVWICYENYYFFIIILLCILYYITLLINKGLSGTVTAGSDLRPTDQTKWTLLPVGPIDWTTWSFLLIQLIGLRGFFFLLLRLNVVARNCKKFSICCSQGQTSSSQQELLPLNHNRTHTLRHIAAVDGTK